MRAPVLDVERCCRSVETFNKSVENMMFIKRVVEIKESAEQPRGPSVSVAICALAVYSYSACYSVTLSVCLSVCLSRSGAI